MPRNSKRKIPGVPERRTIFATPELQNAFLSVVGKKIRSNKNVNAIMERITPVVQQTKNRVDSRRVKTSVPDKASRPTVAQATARKVVELFSNPKVKISSNNPMTKVTRQAVDKVSNLLRESNVTPQNLIASVFNVIPENISRANRTINRAARKLVNKSEQSGYLTPKQAARWRYAIETHARKDRQVWLNPLDNADFEFSPNRALSEELLKPSDIRNAYREGTVQRLFAGAKQESDTRNRLANRIVQQDEGVDPSVKQTLALQQEKRKQRQEQRADFTARTLRGPKQIDDEGNESYDYKALEGNINDLVGLYGKTRTALILGGIGTAAKWVDNAGIPEKTSDAIKNVYNMFGKRQTPQTGKYAMKKMMGGKTGRMGKELTGVDGEKGRYFQKSRTAKRMTQKFYEVDKPHAPQMRAMQQGVSKRAKVREKITEFASPYGSPVQVQGYSVSRSYTTKRRVTKGTSRNARKIHEINDYNYYGDEKMRRPNTFRKNALGNSMNIGGGMNNFMSGNQMMPRRNMVQPPMPRVKTPSPMGLRSMNPMRPMGSTRFTAYPTARSMATGMPPTMRGGFGKRGR